MNSTTIMVTDFKSGVYRFRHTRVKASREDRTLLRQIMSLYHQIAMKQKSVILRLIDSRVKSTIFVKSDFHLLFRQSAAAALQIPFRRINIC